MNVVKTILIILLATATLAAATERAILWTGKWLEIFEVDSETGNIIDSFDRPDGYYMHIAYDGAFFWAAHYIDVREIAKFDQTGHVISTFNIPEGTAVGGITYANASLWYITYVDPPGEVRACHMDLSGNLISPEPFAVNEYSEDLAWDGEYLWMVTNGADFWRGRCYDVETGECVDWFYVGDSFYETETTAIGTDGTYIYTIGFERLHDGGTSYVYKYSKTGTLLDHVYTPVDGWHAKVAYWEEEISLIEPMSLGEIKACFR
jgi:hypothetical protein